MKMHNCLFLLLFVLGFTTTGQLAAQGEDETATTYVQMDYMKVAPGMHEEYRALEAVWRKIHAENIKAGKYNLWVLAQVAFPSGAHTSHNYVTRIMFRGEAQLANFMNGDFMPENLETILNEKERALVNRTAEIRTLVKSEVFSSQEYIEAEDAEFGPGMVTVFNYFASPDGRNMNPADHLAAERDHWMPAHQERTKAGNMMAWVLLAKELPYGDHEAYHSATVDVYRDMNAYLTSNSPMPSMQSLYTPEQMQSIMQVTNEVASLIQAEVRVELDRLKR